METGSRKRISFEFFPPQGAQGAMRLWTSVERLAPLGPEFVSVTYGAGGSTRDRTIAAIHAIRQRARLDVAGHLTCVGATKMETMAVAHAYGKMGCTRIVALRGDAPDGGEFEPHPGGYAGSVELIEAIAKLGRFEISVGAYPERHPDAASWDADIEQLKRKEDAGATEAITQFFFEHEVFLRFRDKARAAGVTMPIIPGVLPIENFGKMARFAARCGATVPEWMATAYANAEAAEAAELLSLSIAGEICDALLKEGAERLHIYTLNTPDLTYQLCQALGVEAAATRIAAVGGCG